MRTNAMCNRASILLVAGCAVLTACGSVPNPFRNSSLDAAQAAEFVRIHTAIKNISVDFPVGIKSADWWSGKWSYRELADAGILRCESRLSSDIIGCRPGPNGQGYVTDPILSVEEQIAQTQDEFARTVLRGIGRPMRGANLRAIAGQLSEGSYRSHRQVEGEGRWEISYTRHWTPTRLFEQFEDVIRRLPSAQALLAAVPSGGAREKELKMVVIRIDDNWQVDSVDQ